jgi:hypothetical protein
MEPSDATVTAIVAELVPSEQVMVAEPALTEVMTMPLFTAAVATEAALLEAAVAVKPRVPESLVTVLVCTVNTVAELSLPSSWPQELKIPAVSNVAIVTNNVIFLFIKPPGFHSFIQKRRSNYHRVKALSRAVPK